MSKARYIAVFQEGATSEPPTPNPALRTPPAALYSLSYSLTPRMEACPLPGVSTVGLVLEISESQEGRMLTRLYRQGDLRLGAASTRTAAVLAALTEAGIVPDGEEAAFLAPLPVDALRWLSLDWSPDLERIFFRWGIAELRQLQALPDKQLAARLGEAGSRLQRLARGEDPIPFQPYEPESDYEEGKILEWELDSLEPLTFLLSGMLESICERLRQRGLAADAVEVRLRLREGDLCRRLNLAFPLSSPKALLSLLRLDLQEHPPQSEILEVRLRAHPTQARTLQYSLLQTSVPDPDKLSRTLARLIGLVGEENLGRPLPLDTHRPDAFVLRPFRIETEPRRRRRRTKGGGESPTLWDLSRLLEKPIALTLRRLRPPRPLRIEKRDVRVCSGPWRLSGDWWRGDLERSGWGRDEWDVEFKDGALCRVFWDHAVKDWFLDGIYD